MLKEKFASCFSLIFWWFVGNLYGIHALLKHDSDLCLLSYNIVYVQNFLCKNKDAGYIALGIQTTLVWPYMTNHSNNPISLYQFIFRVTGD
jgi:hypothetical protein